jgi:hypothetical protein
MQLSFIQVLDLGKGIKADLYFITHAIHFNMHPCRCFLNKVSLEVSYHGRENREE